MNNNALLLALTGIALYGALIPLVLRAFPTVSAAVLVTTCAGIVYVLITGAAVATALQIAFWPYTVIFWFAALCLLMAFGAVYKSISLKILFDLLSCPDRTERYDVILTRYVRSDSFHRRLGILVDLGLAVHGSPRFTLTRKGRRLAVVVAWLQLCFGIERSG